MITMEIAISELALQMFEIYKALQKYHSARKGFQKQRVPLKLKLQILLILEQHNGLDLLSDAFGISAETLFAWYKAHCKQNPENRKLVRLKKSCLQTDMSTALPSHQKKQEGKIASSPHFKGARTIEEVRKVLPNHVVEECAALRSQLEQSALDDSLRRRIANLASEIENPGPVALLLGVPKSIIRTWQVSLPPV